MSFIINPYQFGITFPTIAGLYARYRADLGVTKDGSDKVSQWDDQSGNARHLAMATAAYQPLWVASGINSLNTINFDGTDDTLSIASLSQAQPIHIFMVFVQDTWADLNALMVLRPPLKTPYFDRIFMAVKR